MKYYDPKIRRGFDIFVNGIPKNLAYDVFCELDEGDELKDFVSISKNDFDNKLLKMTFGLKADEVVKSRYQVEIL